MTENNVRMLVHFFFTQFMPGTSYVVCDDLNNDADVEPWQKHKVILVFKEETLYSRDVRDLNSVVMLD